MSVNKAILVGNLGADVDYKTLPSGTQVANFTIATTESWNNKDTGEKQERTEWHKIVAYGRLAEVCGSYLEKGRQVYIEGKIRTRSWDGQDGQKRYTTEIIAEYMQMLGGRPGGPSD